MQQVVSGCTAVLLDSKYKLQMCVSLVAALAAIPNCERQIIIALFKWGFIVFLSNLNDSANFFSESR